MPELKIWGNELRISQLRSREILDSGGRSALSGLGGHTGDWVLGLTGIDIIVISRKGFLWVGQNPNTLITRRTQSGFIGLHRN